MIYLSLFCVILLHIKLFGQRGLIDPISVFFLAFLYYSYLTPIVIYEFEIFSVDFRGVDSWVPPETVDSAAILFGVGYAGFALAYYALTGGSRKTSYAPANAQFKRLLTDPYLRLLLGFVLIVILVISTAFREALLSSTESYEGKISGNYSNYGYAFLMSIALTSFSLILNYTVLNARRFLLATGIGISACIFLTVLTFSKFPLIFAALASFCALYRFNKLPFLIQFIGLLVGTSLMTIIFLPMFSIFRASGELEFVGLNAQSVKLMIAEASSPFTIVHLGFSGYIDAGGHPLWESFALWVPRAIWVDRPLDIAEGFARQVLGEWQAGQGLGFSPFAEAYARTGLLGSFFFMALLGGVMALMQRGFASVIPAAMRAPATLTIGGIVSVLMLRGPFSALITQSIQNWLPIIAVSVVAGWLARRI
ncbi:MAG: O-antigen polysaccharide polymerase Wzy [Sphingomonadaceae bacterium]